MSRLYLEWWLNATDLRLQVLNTAGSIKTTIRLQPKGPPERPEFLSVVGVGHNYVTLQWMPGFDGGVQSTRYTVAYRQSVRNMDNEIESDCNVPSRSGNGGDWFEFECQKNNPCNVSSLEQHQTYAFKVTIYVNLSLTAGGVYEGE